jgi:hypothetical protein
LQSIATPDYEYKEFPKLMIYNDRIVLMYSKKENLGQGTVVYCSKDWYVRVFQLGEYETSWYLSLFEDFHRTVKLTNY